MYTRVALHWRLSVGCLLHCLVACADCGLSRASFLPPRERTAPLWWDSFSTEPQRKFSSRSTLPTLTRAALCQRAVSARCVWTRVRCHLFIECMPAWHVCSPAAGHNSVVPPPKTLQASGGSRSQRDGDEDAHHAGCIYFTTPSQHMESTDRGRAQRGRVQREGEHIQGREKGSFIHNATHAEGTYKTKKRECVVYWYSI